MSWVELRLACLASPARARSLLTVRAAISSAVSSFSPRSRRPSLMWSYWRSRLSLQASCGMGASPFVLGTVDANGAVAVHSRRLGDQPLLSSYAHFDQSGNGLGGAGVR